MQHTGKVDHQLDKFGEDLLLVRNSKLRLTQKLSMIQHCLVPMIKFRLVYGLAAKGAACVQVDLQIREKKVRGFLHLPSYTSNDVMYTPRKLGGLGLPCPWLRSSL